MLANAPYIEYNDFLPDVSNIVIEQRFEKKKPLANTADASLFNFHMKMKMPNTLEVIQQQSNIAFLAESYQKVKGYIEHYSHIFSNIPEEIVLMNYMHVLNNIIKAQPEAVHTDISIEDECLFVFFQKGKSKVFFNIFFDDGIEALINISTEQQKYTIESNIENGISQMSKLFANMEQKAHVSKTFAA